MRVMTISLSDACKHGSRLASYADRVCVRDTSCNAGRLQVCSLLGLLRISDALGLEVGWLTPCSHAWGSTSFGSPTRDYAVHLVKVGGSHALDSDLLT